MLQMFWVGSVAVQCCLTRPLCAPCRSLDRVHGWVKLVDAAGSDDNNLHNMSFDAPVNEQGYADVELLLKDK